MKNSVLVLLMTLGLALSAVSSTAMAGDKGGETKINPAGDDLFPWPWGTECPFPWNEIQGMYQVKAIKEGAYNGHWVVFSVEKEGRDGVKFLSVEQFDRSGKLFSQGQGYSQKDQRIVKGVLKTVEAGREYVVMVRSYVKNEGRGCNKNNLVTAITFCPMRGKKCMENSNYVLLKTTE